MSFFVQESRSIKSYHHLNLVWITFSIIFFLIWLIMSNHDLDMVTVFGSMVVIYQYIFTLSIIFHSKFISIIRLINNWVYFHILASVCYPCCYCNISCSFIHCEIIWISTYAMFQNGNLQIEWTKNCTACLLLSQTKM